MVVGGMVLCMIEGCNVYVMNSLLYLVVMVGMGVGINVLGCNDL